MGEKVKQAKTVVNSTVAGMAQKNANLLTGFMAVAVLVVGMSLVNGRDTWWISAVAIGVVFLALFFYLNARVLIKAGITFLVAIFSAQFALQGGLVVEPRSTIGFVWLTVQMFLFFALIASSYLIMGQRSRWTSTSWGLIGGLFSGALLGEIVSLEAAVALSIPVGFLIFLAYYRGIGRLTENRKLMPESKDSETIEEAIYAHCEAEGWECRRFLTKTFRRTPESNYLVWNGTHAYVLHPVELTSKLGVSPGRKSSKLVHRGASINTWLLNLVNRSLPLWRARNAPMMLVLLDITSKNGTSAETIGVAMPDTGKKIPVGIYPAKGMLGTVTKKSRGVLSDIEKNYGVFNSPLTEKHLKAMEEIGLVEESEYLTPAEGTA